MESLAQRRHLHSVSLDPYDLLTLFSGLVTLLVGLILGLFLGFLVMIVKLAASYHVKLSDKKFYMLL